jgi:hypothetical protein
MWTTENRPLYNRAKLRYPSDLTDDEWVLVEPLIPTAKRGGRRRLWLVETAMHTPQSPHRSMHDDCAEVDRKGGVWA